MKDQLFLIGIGGTGMRCLEAFVHTCAMGMYDTFTPEMLSAIADPEAQLYASNFVQFLDSSDGETPFCFWYGGFEPHRGYEYKSGERAGKRIDDIDKVPAFWPDKDSVRHDMLDYAFEVLQ